MIHGTGPGVFEGDRSCVARTTRDIHNDVVESGHPVATKSWRSRATNDRIVAAGTAGGSAEVDKVVIDVDRNGVSVAAGRPQMYPIEIRGGVGVHAAVVVAHVLPDVAGSVGLWRRPAIKGADTHTA